MMILIVNYCPSAEKLFVLNIHGKDLSSYHYKLLINFFRMLDMSNTSLMGGERISCMPSNLRRGSVVPPLMNLFTIDQVLRRQSCVPAVNDTLDENFLNVSCIVVDDRDPFDDHIRRQILEKRGVNYALMENYSHEKTNLPSILAKNKIGTKVEKVQLGLLAWTRNERS